MYLSLWSICKNFIIIQVSLSSSSIVFCIYISLPINTQPNDRKSENCRCFPRQDILSRCFHFWVFEIIVSSLTFLAIGSFTLPISGGAKLLITKDACRVDQPGLYLARLDNVKHWQICLFIYT